MKPNRKNPILLASLTFALTLAAPSAFAANLYWDTNGTGSAGSGAATGTWGTSVFWSTDSTGANVGSPVLTATTTGVDDLFFSAGTNGTGGTVTVNSTQTARLLTLQEGAITFSGGTISLAGGGGITVNSGGTSGNAIISSSLTVSGNNIFNVGSGRTITLNTGTFTRNAGATVNIQGAGNGSSTMTNLTTTDMVNGIIGPWASILTGTSTTYAKLTSGFFNVLGYTGAADGVSAAASTDVVTGTGNLNYTTAATSGNLGLNASINTLRYSGAIGTLGTDTSFTTKGIMNSGTGLLTFSGAVTSGAAGTEMVVNTANADIAFNGAFTGTITKTGSGTMTLGNVAHSVGGITVNQGILISDGSGITGNSTVNSGGTLLATKAAVLPGYNLASRVSVLNGATLAVRAGGTGEWVSSEIDSLLGATTAAFASGSNLGVEVTASNSFTYANDIGATQAAKGLTKSGAGTLILSGANTYTGTTSIGAGTLKLSGAGTPGAAGSNVAVSGGALLDLNGTNQNIKFIAGTEVGTVANNSGSGTSILTLAASPAANVLIQDYTTTPGGKVAVIVTVNTSGLSADNTYSGGTTVNAGAFFYNNIPGSAGSGTITLPASGANAAASSGLLVNGGTYANDVSGAGYIHNNVNGSSTTRFTGTLNTSGTFNFRHASAAFEFAGSGNSILSGVIGPAGAAGVFGPNITVSTGRIIKSGSGTLTLSGNNIYTGTTTISGGTLSASKIVVSGGNSNLGNAASAVTLGSAGAEGTLSYTGNTAIYTRGFTIGGAGGGRLDVTTSGQTLTVGTKAVTGSGLFTVGGAGDTSITANLTHSGGLTKTGAGTLTLSSSSNTYTGDTVIKAGTLQINTSTSIGSSNKITVGDTGSSGTVLDATTAGLSVGASQTLAGIGQVLATGQTVSIAGTLAPGNSAGTLSLTVGILDLGNATALAFELNPSDTTVGGAINDLVAVTGNLNLDGLLSVVATSGDFLSVAANTSWRLFNYSGTLTDDTLSLGSMPSLGSGLSWSIDTATSGQVNLVAIPEPNAAALIGGFGLLALLRRRRKC